MKNNVSVLEVMNDCVHDVLLLFCCYLFVVCLFLYLLVVVVTVIFIFTQTHKQGWWVKPQDSFTLGNWVKSG